MAGRNFSVLKSGSAIFLAWTIYGLLLGQQIFALRGAGGLLTTRLRCFTYELAYSYSWAALTPFILWLGRRWPLEDALWWRRAPLHVVAGMMIAGLAQTSQVLLLWLVASSWFPPPQLSRLPVSILSTLDYGSIIYWVVLLVGQSFLFIRRYHDDQLQKAELQAQLAEAQIQALRMQLHPHFLFNALNSLSELIHSDPTGADRMVARLSQLLRIFLRSAETQEVPLAEEIDFLQRYLEIQKIRFEDRLNVTIQLDPGTTQAAVPCLILQPLIENAIRHGLAESENPGLIEIDSRMFEGHLQLRVLDSGDGTTRPADAQFHEGTGLRNTRRRLERLYGGNHQFRLENRSSGGVLATITIPFKLATQAAGVTLA